MRSNRLVGLASLFIPAMAHTTDYINPHADETIGSVRALYSGRLDPDLQISTCRNIDRLFPVRIVEAGEQTRRLPEKTVPFTYFQYESKGQSLDLYDYMAIARVTGLLVLHEGEIAYERYLAGNTQSTRWMSMSIAKSISSVLVGAAIADGSIKSIDDAITDYLPGFAGSAYDGVTIRQLLQMTSGVQWNETYTDHASDRRAMLEAQIGQQPGAILELMASLPRAATPGSKFNYSTGETHLVGALLRAATGMPVAEYLSQKVWVPAGMEADASWWLESPDGLEVGGSGVSAVLRDYARFGLFMMEDGVAGGRRILPEYWMADAASPKQVGDEWVDYGYMLWPLRDAAYSAIGIFGQFVYVNPSRKIVVAMWSAQPKPMDRSGLDEYDFLAALAKAVHNFYSGTPAERFPH